MLTSQLHLWDLDKGVKTAVASHSSCEHSFVILKTDNTMVQWYCNDCYAGPGWLIYECQYCRYYRCGTCMMRTTSSMLS
ncbi:hypothetical protein C8A01DRAFT_18614 [Parachaetomium inaequale]|uniref:Uncharacterized protein n=1 Tax=Parachaetomium inaequale TaxID=2588326 RepID=A0AAN6PC26_9PEZI|nr:hypothetical protein C8A01DRAFT_18614 [Parachaetomium inaequale]